MEVQLRSAKAGDESMLLKWRNIPALIALSSSVRPVTRLEHRRWYAETLRGLTRKLFIIEAGSRPAGIIRYDLASEGVAEISIYLLPEFQCRGVGMAAFHLSIPLLLEWRRIDEIAARVLSSNERSVRFFERLGFIATNDPKDSEFLDLRGKVTPGSDLAALGSAEVPDGNSAYRPVGGRSK